MKVLLFTHGQDIDGAGCAILARKAFDECTIVPTKTFDITSNVKRAIEDGSIYDYDHVFVTDLCIKEPVLGEIDRNEVLRSKINVIDHHKTEIEEGNDKYDFVDITVKKGDKKVSGTSLFYDYLQQQGYLQPTPVLDELTEWTRQYDIWEWVQHNNFDARKLHILYETLGYDRYFELINRKVDNDTSITFTEEEEAIVREYDRRLAEAIDKMLAEMVVGKITLDGQSYRIGYVHCPYKFRNDIDGFVSKDNKHNIDTVGMIMTDTETVSYRQVKDVDVSVVAKHFNGKGHREAGTHLQNNEKFQKFLRSISFERE